MAEPPYSVEEFLKIVTALSTDMSDCATAIEVLARDEEKNAETLPFWRRMCAYSTFALIANATYHMMYIAYVARHLRDVVFTLEELTVLENAYDFNEDGEIEAGLNQTQMLERIKFAFNAFARVHNSDYILPHTPGRAGIEELLRVKTGISLPQSAAELEVSNANVTGMLVGAEWFMQRLFELIESCRDSARDRLAAWEAEKDEPIM